MTIAREDRGAEAVEFALIVPILLLLVFGIAEFGRAYYIQTMISAGARDGVRVMALQNDPAAARAAARNGVLPLVVPDSQITITPVSCVATPTTPNATATVTVRYTMGFVSDLFGADITLSGKGTMRCSG